MGDNCCPAATQFFGRTTYHDGMPCDIWTRGGSARGLCACNATGPNPWHFRNRGLISSTRRYRKIDAGLPNCWHAGMSVPRGRGDLPVGRFVDRAVESYF